MSHLFKQVNITAAERSAFGEPVTIQTTPVLQLDGIFGIDDTSSWQINQAGTGYADVDNDNTFAVHSGTGVGSFCTLRSKRSVRYRPGQGSMCRFTSRWPDGGQVGYQQVAGFINQSDVLGIGYNVDGNFGVIRRYNSKGELWKISITAAAGSETITITLNDVVHNITISAQSSTAATAAAIATAIDWQAVGWIVDYSSSDVFFLYNGPPSDLSGVFSFASSGTATATTTTLINGAAPTDSWTYQNAFSKDPLDGTGPSGMTIDTSKLNVFQIDFRWLGAGIIRFAIEDDANGELIIFHEIHYTNRNTVPSLSNPAMRVGMAVVNAAPQLGTGIDVHMKGASIVGSIQGPIIRNNVSKAVRSATTSNLAINQYHHILTIKNKRVFGYTAGVAKLNQRELLLEEMSVGAQVTAGQRPLEVLIYKNASFDNGAGTAIPLIYTNRSETAAVSSTTALLNALNPGELIAAYSIAPSSAINIDLSRHRIILTPTDTLSVVVLSLDAQITNTVTSLIFIEE